MGLEESRTHLNPKQAVKRPFGTYLRYAFTAVGIWGLVQGVYLNHLVGFTTDPSPTAELTYAHKAGWYITLGLLLGSALSSGLILILVEYKKIHGSHSDFVVSWTGFWIMATLFAVVAGTLVGFSNMPSSFIDGPNETIVIRQIALFPKGIEEKQKSFTRMSEFRGQFYDFNPEYSRYEIRSIIDDGLEVVMRIGSEQPAAASTKPDLSTVAFAELIAAKTGAELEWVGKMCQRPGVKCIPEFL